MNLPLEGLRILAVEQYGAGPYGTCHLADMGAEVIKIEHLASGGDMSRGVGPYFLGAHDSEFYQTFNRNKSSVCISALEGHPRAMRAYAWSSPIEGSDKRRFYAVLHVPPVRSPADAVRAAIVAEHRREM